jgi:hypothetical protein
MRVFISWSGERSKTVAALLRDWLTDVIQGVQPWMSATDIMAGARWNNHVQRELTQSSFGVICLTHDNQRAPWLLFEAGALAKSLDDAHVCPFLIDLDVGDLAPGPFGQFQAKRADRQGTLELLQAINRLAGERGLTDEKLGRAFERWWPDLNKQLASLPAAEASASPDPRPSDDTVQEILMAVRELTRRLPLEFMPSSEVMRAMISSARSGDVADAAARVRTLLAQVPDATLMTEQFWDGLVAGMKNAIAKTQGQ